MTCSDMFSRLGQFTVPGVAHDEFVQQVRPPHDLLRQQPSIVQEQPLADRTRTSRLRIRADLGEYLESCGA